MFIFFNFLLKMLKNPWFSPLKAVFRAPKNVFRKFFDGFWVRKPNLWYSGILNNTYNIIWKCLEVILKHVQKKLNPFRPSECYVLSFYLRKVFVWLYESILTTWTGSTVSTFTCRSSNLVNECFSCLAHFFWCSDMH